MRLLACLLILVVACGDDPPAGNPTAPAAAGTPPAAAPGAPGTPAAGSGKPLPRMRHAEDRVECPVPREGSKKCDPNATKPPAGSAAPDLTCGENELCMNTTVGYMCSRCEERFRIRREFKDGEKGDFTADLNRDPFQSFVVKVPGAGSATGDGGTPADAGGKCGRQEQLRVVNYGYQDLKLVGIVTQGTQRKVLLMDPGNKGHIIKSGDCVGKEKAWVKSIGDNFICFEPSEAAAARSAEDCKELHNKQLTVTELPGTGSTTAPVLPSGTTTPAPVPAPTGPTTTIVPARPMQQQVPAPQSSRDAPVNLKP